MQKNRIKTNLILIISIFNNYFKNFMSVFILGTVYKILIIKQNISAKTKFLNEFIKCVALTVCKKCKTPIQINKFSSYVLEIIKMLMY